MRAAILFASLVILATATFADANAWIEPLPEIRKLPIAARVAILYVPYVILVGVLWLWARIGPRVHGHIGWFVALAVAAAAVVFTMYATPLLMLVVALLLLRLTPRVGSLYEAASFPSIRAFVGFTLLFALSTRWGADVFGLEYAAEMMPRVPHEGLALIVAAICAAGFIAILRLRQRRMQPCAAVLWLTAGILAVVAAALAAHLPSNVAYGFFASAALGIIGHLALFIGCFLLLSHLLPRRAADEAH